MPELPEVETVKKSLSQLVLGKTIKEVDVYYDRIIQNVTVDEFKCALCGQTINKIERIGKYLIFIFDSLTMASHLRMEGKYFLRTNEVLSKHDHIVFKFTDNTELRYNDTRKFGTMDLYNTTDINEVKMFPPLNKLGLEPFDAGFTNEYLLAKFKKKNAPIKTVLLDQTIISGLGNIYADEVCFMAKISPFKITSTITPMEVDKIRTSSITVLTKAIAKGGTTIKSFVNSHSATGLFQNELLVHTKTNCPICNNKITKKFVGGRGTYYCSNCQNVEKKYVVAITGGIATGKSTVIEYIKSLNYPVFDCDKLSKAALLDVPAKKLVNHYKDEILTDGEIDRAKLAAIIFNSAVDKKYVESIIHPYVLDKLSLKIASTDSKLVFVEVQLLFEAKLEYIADYIVVVDARRDLQIARLTNDRLMNEVDAIKRLNSQMPQAEKIKLADYVIDNNQDYQSMKNQVNDLLTILKGKVK